MERRLKCSDSNISVGVIDGPGAGGASHHYEVMVMDDHGCDVTQIRFQNGPIAEQGVNGLTQEVLLAIVEDRLKCFQAGEFSCRENAVALTKVQEALMWLNKRTADRVARGVEGKSVV
jgi:hypothetical protein